MSRAKEYPPERTKLLLETLKWWIQMLAAVVRRMGVYLDRQVFIQQMLSHEGKRPITDYFSETEVEDMVMERDHPQLVELRMQADAYFVASALYQIDALLKKLASQPIWRGEFATKGSHYRKLYKENQLLQLRNFIEHADEHIAENKLEIASDFSEGFGIKAWSATKRFFGGVDTFYVYGTEFQVIYAVEAAKELIDHLPNADRDDSALVWDV